MRALLIGGTGVISSAVASYAVQKGWDITVLNRGERQAPPADCRAIRADIRDSETVSALIRDMKFDSVVDFVAFKPEDIQRDIALFSGKTEQYVFISSATVYQKPHTAWPIREDFPVGNPYSAYAANKLACERYLEDGQNQRGFSYTIVRPSHTYGVTSLPVAIHGKNGSWSVLSRILSGKPVIVHGDGSSLWTITHNTDFAKALVGLMGNPAAYGEKYHITSDTVLTWNDVYRLIGEAAGIAPRMIHIPTDFLTVCDDIPLGLQAALQGDKSHSAVFDNTKIKTLVPDFICTTSPQKGLAMSVDRFLQDSSLQKEDPAFDVWCDKVISAYRCAASACNIRFETIIH